MSEEKIHVWHEQQEKILKEWSEISSCYRYMHDRAHGKFHTQNLWVALPVIVLSTVTGTANFAHEAFPVEWKDYVPLAIGFLNLTAGLITTIGQFLRVSEKMEGHRAASISYSKLARNIQVELSLPIPERAIDGASFIMECRLQLDRLLEQSPDLDDQVIKQFEKKFRDHDFYKPAIIDLRAIDVYKNDDEADKKKNALIIKEEMAHRKMIVEEERQFRQVIIDEQKKDHTKNMHELKRIKTKKAINKLENITAADIGNKMTKLLGRINKTKPNFTPSSSDNDSPISSASSDTPIISTTENIIINISDISNNIV